MFVNTHREPFIFSEISIIFSRSRSRSGYRGRAEQSRTNFGRSWTLRDRAIGLAFRDYRRNIVDKTARRYCSREISVDNSIETSCETLPWLTIDCYMSEISSFLPPPPPLPSCPSFPSHSNRMEINSRSHWWKLLTRDSAWFSSARFLFDDRQGERTSGCRSTIASSSSREEVFVDTARERTRRTRTDHWAQVAVSGVTILLSLTVFLNLVAETLPQVSDAIPLLGTTEFLHRANV